MLHDGTTEFRQRRAAAVLAALLWCDKRSAEAALHAVDEQPCPPIRQPHITQRLPSKLAVAVASPRIASADCRLFVHEVRLLKNTGIGQDVISDGRLLLGA
jgi:hypothetical protein